MSKGIIASFRKENGDEAQYTQLIRDILEHGTIEKGRNGGTRVRPSLPLALGRPRRLKTRARSRAALCLARRHGLVTCESTVVGGFKVFR